jgi:uncharacterized protein YndB with AHSA1/START domain
VHRELEGDETTFYGEYLEIQAPERIVWTFNFDDTTGGPETSTFEEHDGRTTIMSRAEFPSKEIRDQVIASGMEGGAAETYDRLDEYLEVLKSRV